MRSKVIIIVYYDTFEISSNSEKVKIDIKRHNYETKKYKLGDVQNHDISYNYCIL